MSTICQAENFQVAMNLDLDGIYKRLEEAWGVKGQASLALKLGLSSANTIARAKVRGGIPEVWILRTMLETHCREEWLLTGEEPRMRGHVLVADLDPQIREIITVLSRLDDTKIGIAIRSARLLASGQPHVIARHEEDIAHIEDRILIARELLLGRLPDKDA
jgi:hypothetical protein